MGVVRSVLMLGGLDGSIIETIGRIGRADNEEGADDENDERRSRGEFQGGPHEERMQLLLVSCL